MELGCDAVLLASAVTRAADPVRDGHGDAARGRGGPAGAPAPAGSRAASTRSPPPPTRDGPSCDRRRPASARAHRPAGSVARGRCARRSVAARGAAAGGVRWVVLREKDLPRAERAALAADLRAMLADVGGTLDRRRPRPARRRRRAPARRRPVPAAGAAGLVGRSCHDRAELDRLTTEDYVTLSPVYPTATKPGTARRWARTAWRSWSRPARAGAGPRRRQTPEQVPPASRRAPPGWRCWARSCAPTTPTGGRSATLERSPCCRPAVTLTSSADRPRRSADRPECTVASRPDDGDDPAGRAHHRRLRLRRRRRHPGRPEDLRRARRVRHQRDHRGHRAEHPGRRRRACRCRRASSPRSSTRCSPTSPVARGEDGHARHPGGRRRGGRARPGTAGCRTWSSTRCWSPPAGTGSAWWARSSGCCRTPRW